jgi:hypothetical protein
MIVLRNKEFAKPATVEKWAKRGTLTALVGGLGYGGYKLYKNHREEKERQRQELLDAIKNSKNFSEEAVVDPTQQAKKKKSLLRPFLGTGGMSAKYLKNGSID